MEPDCNSRMEVEPSNNSSSSSSSSFTGLSHYESLIFFLLALILLSQSAESAAVKDWSPRRGCHVIGHRRTLRIEGCEPVEVALNACRGQCLSWSVPSPRSVLFENAQLRITSYALCCRMANREMTTHVIQCVDGPRTLEIPSATACECFDCNQHHTRGGT